MLNSDTSTFLREQTSYRHKSTHLMSCLHVYIQRSLNLRLHEVHLHVLCTNICIKMIINWCNCNAHHVHKGMVYEPHHKYFDVNFNTPDRQSKTFLTIDERGKKIARHNVFDCHLSPVGRQWQSKTMFLTIFDLRSSMVLTFSIAA